MVTQCPSCGRNMEAGQTVCACGWRAETPVSKSNVIAVVLIGVLLIVVILGTIAVLGVVAWNQFGKSPEPAPQTVTTDSAPAEQPSPPATVVAPIKPAPLPQENPAQTFG